MPDPKDPRVEYPTPAVGTIGPTAHVTQPVDPNVVLNRLFDNLREDFRAGREESRLHHSETRDELRQVSARIESVEGGVRELQKSDKSLFEEVQRHGHAITHLQGQVEQLWDARKRDIEEVARAHERVSQSDTKRAEEMHAWQQHTKQLEKSITSLVENDKKLLENDKKQDETLSKQNKTLENQTALLADLKGAANTIIQIARSPRVAAYVAIGAIVGGAIMAIADKVLK